MKCPGGDCRSTSITMLRACRVAAYIALQTHRIYTTNPNSQGCLVESMAMLSQSYIYNFATRMFPSQVPTLYTLYSLYSS